MAGHELAGELRFVEGQALLDAGDWSGSRDALGQASALAGYRVYEQSVAAGGPAPVDGAEARRSLEMALAVYRSAREGREVEAHPAR